MTPDLARPTDQSPFSIRFDWGERGLEAVAVGCRAIVLVDVLSFGTCVDIATARGGAVYPYPYRDDTAARFARERGAILAQVQRSACRYSLSPQSLLDFPTRARLVLPSPNGSTLSRQAARMGKTVAGCLRNAAAIASFVRTLGGPVAVIACGERWPDGSLRPAWEDLVGAGAVIAHLPEPRSPEAESACAAFRRAESDLAAHLRSCSSGRELLDSGFAADIELAAAVGVSRCVPVLIDNVYVQHATG